MHRTAKLRDRENLDRKGVMSESQGGMPEKDRVLHNAGDRFGQLCLEDRLRFVEFEVHLVRV